MTDNQRRVDGLRAALDSAVDAILVHFENGNQPGGLEPELYGTACVLELLEYYEKRGTPGHDISRPARRKFSDA